NTRLQSYFSSFVAPCWGKDGSQISSQSGRLLRSRCGGVGPGCPGGQAAQRMAPSASQPGRCCFLFFVLSWLFIVARSVAAASASHRLHQNFCSRRRKLLWLKNFWFAALRVAFAPYAAL